MQCAVAVAISFRKLSHMEYAGLYKIAMKSIIFPRRFKFHFWRKNPRLLSALYIYSETLCSNYCSLCTLGLCNIYRLCNLASTLPFLEYQCPVYMITSLLLTLSPLRFIGQTRKRIKDNNHSFYSRLYSVM